MTQAGRGGMEWLAGGRGVSPYSAQATAALKAAFPTQWPTIRDYGFAHPEIVGYMNAYAPEDAKIAYSLVEGIGTRWIVNEGTSYFNTGYDTNANTKWTIKFYISNYTQNARHGESTSGARFYIGCNNGNFITGYGSDYNHSIKTSDNKPHVATLYNAVLTFDGTNYSAGNAFTSSMRMWIFDSNGYASNVRGGVAESIFEEEGVQIKRFIPFKRNGQMELLDLVSGNLATRVGTFTELIESPS